MQTSGQGFLRQWKLLRSMGVTAGMDDFERRKLIIFNQLNCFSMLAGIVLLLAGLSSNRHLPPLTWYVAVAPLFIGTMVLWLNHEKNYRNARLVYFSLYPLVTCVVYLGRVHVGIGLFFIVYIVSAVFFLQRMVSMVFAFLWCSSCFLLAVVVPREYYFQLSAVSYWIYAFNHVLALGFIFYALYLIKQEHLRYQFALMMKSRELHQQNLAVNKHRKEIAEKAALLESQTIELTELNLLKSKLFSVIAHDLKTPMYALRNLFLSMQQSKLSAKEIKGAIPGITNEMNYVTSLMENLLVWAKSQMSQAAVQRELLDIHQLVTVNISLLRLQAENKKISLECKVAESVCCYADKEMVNLVIRNLLSNAIKFTPAHGTVWVSAAEHDSVIELSVQDTGIGISKESLKLLFGDHYYTTRGTNSETGTGLGLKLCRDFVEKNGGSIKVRSDPGAGSTFSVILPRYESDLNENTVLYA